MSDDLAYYGDPGDIVAAQSRTKRLIPAERAEKAEAAIKRVRELCEQIVVTADPSARNKYGARHGHWVAQTILRALEEGDVDE